MAAIVFPRLTNRGPIEAVVNHLVLDLLLYFRD